MIYEFHNYRLDADHLMLYRHDEEVSLTPKQVETLLALVERNGEILSKHELMERLWGDTAVEEANLIQNIHFLRKALGQTSDGRPMIETLRRRGYRFTGPVKAVAGGRIASTSMAAPVASNDARVEPSGTGAGAAEPIETVKKQGTDSAWPEAVTSKPKWRFAAVAIVAMIVLFAVGLGSWFAAGRRQPDAPILLDPFRSETITTDGSPKQATISPDGRFVIYSIENRAKQSLWRRDLETGHNSELLPPSDDIYHGSAFSPDGNTVYFVRRPRTNNGRADIYKMPVFGGIPQTIIEGTGGLISISPDGAQIAYLRSYGYGMNDYSALWIARSADGKDERRLASRVQPYRIGDFGFSPDGRSIAFANGQSENAGKDFTISTIAVAGGEEKVVLKEKFFNFRSLAWLPDGRSLLASAARDANETYRIWLVSMDSGTAQQLTNDAETYGMIRLDRKGSMLSATRIEEDFTLRVMSVDGSTEEHSIEDATEPSFDRNGTLYYVSKIGGKREVWSVKADGTGRRQVTSGPASILNPIPGSDEGTVYFSSNQTGTVHVWRMSPDGSSPTQVTRGVGGFALFASLDGEWVYFHHGIDRTLWRVSTRTGEEQAVITIGRTRFAFASDGTRVAYLEKVGSDNSLVIASLPDGKVLTSLKLPEQDGTLSHFAWMPDGSGMAYILTSVQPDRPGDRNTLWFHRFDAPERPTQAASFDRKIAESSGLAMSPDGKRFAISQGGWRHDAVLLSGFR